VCFLYFSNMLLGYVPIFFFLGLLHLVLHTIWYSFIAYHSMLQHQIIKSNELQKKVNETCFLHFLLQQRTNTDVVHIQISCFPGVPVLLQNSLVHASNRNH
jgi:hypothetical protein